MTQHFWNDAITSALLTHLWQSTLFAAFAWMLTRLLRSSRARVRFAVWMTASIKFLIPFALLVYLGRHLSKPVLQPRLSTPFYTVIEEISQPFTRAVPSTAGPAVPAHSLAANSWLPVVLAAVWLCGCLVMLTRWLRQWNTARRLVREAVALNQGREVRALRDAESAMQTRRPVPILLTHKAVEPGVFGFFRPVLIWPAGLSQRLDDAHVRSIIAHELEHVRHCDNMAAAIHAAVEAFLWFHPLLHWMGKKMNEERERACDESVLAQSNQPEKYAEGILKVCAFCLDAPLPCVAGVSGSDLKERVLRIMNGDTGVSLSTDARILLITAASLAALLPVVIGVVRGQSGTAPTPMSSEEDASGLPRYEVASIKHAPSIHTRRRLMLTPDGTRIQGVELQMVLRHAFGVEDDRIIGAPQWTRSDCYDIEAKVAPEDAPKMSKLTMEERNAMLIPVLVDRFNLKYHHETRELPMYALVVAKGGPRMVEKKDLAPIPHVVTDGQNSGRSLQDSAYLPGRMMMDFGRIEGQGTPIGMIVDPLAKYLGRSVIDKTGLTGRYDFTLQWTPDNAPPMTGGPDGPGNMPHLDTASDAPQISLFAAIQEQLGLKLESEKGKVDVIVIDHIEPPTAN